MTSRPIRSRRVRGTCVILTALSLMGCSGCMVTKSGSVIPVPKDPQVIADFNECWDRNQTLGLIPDLGTTQELHLFKCMRQAGWEQKPQRNARALNHYRRIEQQHGTASDEASDKH
jgi:hypothetical protein